VRRPVCAVVLAAGEGRRLRPLTSVLPKALCPVGNVPLLDRALSAVGALGFHGPADVAVNAWHLADQVVAHVGERAHLSVETGPAPLGTGGGLRALRDWIDGRDVLVGNADAYLRGGSVAALLSGWDHDEVRILGVLAGDRPAEFGLHRFAGFSLMPHHRVAELPASEADLVRGVWRPAERDGKLRMVDYGGVYLDSGTPADYLAANLDAARGGLVDATASVTGLAENSVIGAGAVVDGAVERCVVLPGATVRADEHLVETIRYGRDGNMPASARAGAEPRHRSPPN
jgi:MurNAc alpha-1-phosphate uridylyltransferase